MSQMCMVRTAKTWGVGLHPHTTKVICHGRGMIVCIYFNFDTCTRYMCLKLWRFDWGLNANALCTYEQSALCSLYATPWVIGTLKVRSLEQFHQGLAGSTIVSCVLNSVEMLRPASHSKPSIIWISQFPIHTITCIAVQHFSVPQAISTYFSPKGLDHVLGSDVGSSMLTWPKWPSSFSKTKAGGSSRNND